MFNTWVPTKKRFDTTKPVSEQQEDYCSCGMSSNQPLRKRLWSKAERAPISIQPGDTALVYLKHRTLLDPSHHTQEQVQTESCIGELILLISVFFFFSCHERIRPISVKMRNFNRIYMSMCNILSKVLFKKLGWLK